MVDIGLLSLILGFYVIFVHVFQMHVKEVVIFTNGVTVSFESEKISTLYFCVFT